MAACEIPGLIVSVQRGGPGLGTIQPSQSDYRQSVYGGGNGDYHVIVLAPASVQEMADMVGKAFELMFKWRNPVILLSDGCIGQMMEKVRLPEQRRRRSEEQILGQCPWAINGMNIGSRKPNFVSSLELDPAVMEMRNRSLSGKYARIALEEPDYEGYMTDDAEWVIVAYGVSARVSSGAVDTLRKEGIRAGLFRPKTLWPFPEKELAECVRTARGVLTVEMSEGQMYADIRRFIGASVPVSLLSHSGGALVSPDELVSSIKNIVSCDSKR